MDTREAIQCTNYLQIYAKDWMISNSKDARSHRSWMTLRRFCWRQLPSRHHYALIIFVSTLRANNIMWNSKAIICFCFDTILWFKSLKTKQANNLCGIGSSFFFLTRLSHTPTVESSWPVTKNLSSKSTAATRSPCALFYITKYLYYLIQ